MLTLFNSEELVEHRIKIIFQDDATVFYFIQLAIHVMSLIAL